MQCCYKNHYYIINSNKIRHTKSRIDSQHCSKTKTYLSTLKLIVILALPVALKEPGKLTGRKRSTSGRGD